MKKLKEKWQEVNPILLGILTLISIIYLIIWGVSRIIPTDEEIQKNRIDKVNSIKLCIDNGLKAYQSDSGDWWCKPIDYK